MAIDYTLVSVDKAARVANVTIHFPAPTGDKPASYLVPEDINGTPETRRFLNESVRNSYREWRRSQPRVPQAMGTGSDSLVAVRQSIAED